ncbi:MAG: glycosyltransferase family 2 protein, partial [Bacteroidota bacterium]
MKVSIVTVVYNGEATIGEAIASVAAQDYPNIEYIVVDGASKDGTLKVIEGYRDQIATLVSEPDKGIYDAMNKGLKLATGDVIGILNADDVLADVGVISAVVKQMETSGAEALVGDLVFFRESAPEKVVRYYSSKGFQLKRFEKGDMPPHPTFYVRREVYEKYGYFNLDYRIVADFELMLRFLYTQKIPFTYLP